VSYREYRKSIFNKEEVAFERKRKILDKGGRIFIEKYPMGTGTIADIEARLTDLEDSGHKIDVVINDYPEKMDLNMYGKMDKRNQINAVYEEMKRVADQRKILIHSPSQVNREALDKTLPAPQHVAEDLQKLHNSDIIIGLYPAPDLSPRHAARCICVYSRVWPEGLSAVVYWNIDVGQAIAFTAEHERK
jgi:hypothetical protein